MTGQRAFIAPAIVHDGVTLADHALVVAGDRVAGVVALRDLPADVERVDLGSGALMPGYVDLQVNGGGGVMLNDTPAPETMATMAAAHARLGATTILPTLITDRAEVTAAAIDAAVAACAAGVPGIAGLHLEGPHLDPARAGAHDPALIRPMADSDLALLLDAVARLPVLKVTLAPASVTMAQIETLARAGVIVSLGHTEADFATCAAAAHAGAACVTHLFNAMRQLGNREPGVVGAALHLSGLSAGLIADGIHVHPATMGAAIRAKSGPGRLFLVSDAMAVAGTNLDGFTLNGRRIDRADGRLTLADGTLAGADLDLTTALRVLTRDVGVPLAEAVSMATAAPADLIGQGGRRGRFVAGARADVLHLDDDGNLTGVWQGGKRLV
ncbi:N-acetylglucosamine-6-phosphate deacetylase [Meridianimarinicoccus sp. RP-17]|uniref:N-acetylglucosamine-6-phosphate deacetylase n=1 Tax=Meridianimarinicoccus zhengii TaxID=2056810 RepID=UPI000DAE42B7|nr:N-acetylglucosamine-6-phosphate deacetylase [Phycocomes zhengii]